MQILLANQYGAQVVTCDRHVDRAIPRFGKVIRASLAAICDISKLHPISRTCVDCRSERQAAK